MLWRWIFWHREYQHISAGNYSHSRVSTDVITFGTGCALINVGLRSRNPITYLKSIRVYCLATSTNQRSFPLFCVERSTTMASITTKEMWEVVKRYFGDGHVPGSAPLGLNLHICEMDGLSTSKATNTGINGSAYGVEISESLMPLFSVCKWDCGNLFI